MPVEQIENIIFSIKNSSNKLSIKENNCLLNHLNKIVANRNVTVSDTMIKITYKKEMQDCIPSSMYSNTFNCNDPVLNNNKSVKAFIKAPKVQMSQQLSEPTSNMNRTTKCDNECFIVSENTKSLTVTNGSNYISFHSPLNINLKASASDKKEYINRLNFLVKLHKESGKNTLIKINHSKHVSCRDAQNILTNKTKVNLKNMLKKGNSLEKIEINRVNLPKTIRLVKIKDDDINSKNCKLNGKSNTKLETFKRGNNKVEGELKRKLSTNDGIILNKKTKRNESGSQVLKKKFKDSKEISLKKVEPNKVIKSTASDTYAAVNKKEILIDDPSLPAGWKRKIHTRYKGTPYEKHVVYIFSPQGKKFQFKWKLRRYLERTKSNLSAEQFHFGLYKKTKSLYSPLPSKHENENENKDKNKNLSLRKRVSTNKTKQSQTISDKDKTIFPSKVQHPAQRCKKPKSLSQEKIKLSQFKTKTELKNLKLGKSPTKNSTADGRQLLLCDPDLPFGWKRIINSNKSSGKLQVHIISPEGKIFRRRYRLNEYLTKHQYTHSLDRFYFGLYPKKESIDVGNNTCSDVTETNVKSKHMKKLDHGNAMLENNSSGNTTNPGKACQVNDDASCGIFNGKFLFPDVEKPEIDRSSAVDCNLPEGWKRFIKIRSCGKSAGRTEVVIVSPDGRRHRSKGQLEQYLLKHQLSFNANIFDFSTFGKSKQNSNLTELKDASYELKKKIKPSVPCDRPVPDIDLNALKDTETTPEGEMINTVSGIMVACDISSIRSERRLRLPRNEHEKILRSYLDLDGEVKQDGNSISPNWIQKLAKCRSDFRRLDADAASIIAEKTKEFIKNLSLRAFQNSEKSELSLRYDDIANIVHKYECLASLKSLIPKKITYKEYVKLNRPKQFTSFT